MPANKPVSVCNFLKHFIDISIFQIYFDILSNKNYSVCVCVCVCACVRECVRACVRACVCGLNTINAFILKNLVYIYIYIYIYI